MGSTQKHKPLGEAPPSVSGYKRLAQVQGRSINYGHLHQSPGDKLKALRDVRTLWPFTPFIWLETICTTEKHVRGICKEAFFCVRVLSSFFFPFPPLLCVGKRASRRRAKTAANGKICRLSSQSVHQVRSCLAAGDQRQSNGRGQTSPKHRCPAGKLNKCLGSGCLQEVNYTC